MYFYLKVYVIFEYRYAIVIVIQYQTLSNVATEMNKAIFVTINHVLYHVDAKRFLSEYLNISQNIMIS